MERFLQYGVPGLIGLCVVIVVPIVVQAFVKELRESRVERAEMRKDFTATVTSSNAALASAVKEMTSGVTELRHGMNRICDRLEQRPCLRPERGGDGAGSD